MKKQSGRVLFAFLAALVLAFLPIISPSASPGLGPDDPPDFAKETVARARFFQANGNKSFALVPVLVEAVQLTENSYAVTYEVGIPQEHFDGKGDKSSSLMLSMLPFPAQASSDSHNGCDSTVSVCALLTLYYTQIGNHGWYQYMSNRWTRSDPAVSWSSAKLTAACYSDWYGKTGQCIKVETRSIGVPTSGTTYSFTPSFSGSSNQLYIDDSRGIMASQQIKLTRGGSTWWFDFCVAVGSGSWGEGCY